MQYSFETTGQPINSLYMIRRIHTMFVLVLFALIFCGKAEAQQDSTIIDIPPDTALVAGPLIPATSGMDRAWEVPHNPFVDTTSLPTDISQREQVLRGFNMFMDTRRNAPRMSGNMMSCNHCHPNSGQREKGMPLVGVAVAFPEYNKRSGRIFTLEDRIIGCLLRSCNASAKKNIAAHENDTLHGALSAHSPEVQALAAYINWISKGFDVGENISWRGHNTLPQEKLVSMNTLDPKLGRKLYVEHCSGCHGKNGQGVDIGDKRPGPLWGQKSWNDGSGAARTYTLAGIIRYAMPYLNPGSLTDEEAQHIAAYITSKSRPKFPRKEKDYLKEQIPVDAVYYPQLYKTNPLRKGK